MAGLRKILGSFSLVQNRYIATQCPSHVGVWGACFSGGQPHDGVGDAPGLLRQAGLLTRLKEQGVTVTDHGDLVRII